jgi:hypothetical protein
MRLSLFFVFLVVAPVTNVLCGLIYAQQTDQCTSSNAEGNAVFCCSGACLDGTSNGEPGLCMYWENVCYDLNSPPTCSSNQVMVGGLDGVWISAGIGNCWAGNECQWQRNNWTWGCCDCPSGYTAIDHGKCQGSGTSQPACVGCTGFGEVLTGDSTSNFQCLTPTICATAKNIANAIKIIGLGSTWFGAICPTTDRASAVITLYEDAQAIVDAIEDPTDGFLGTTFAEVSALASTVKSFLVGAVIVFAGEELAISAALAETLGLACDLNTILGLILLPLAGQTDDIINKNCKQTKSKRSITMRPNRRSASSSFHANAQRDNGNLCSEFLSYFPTNFSIPTLVDSACDQLSTDTTSGNTTEALTQFCHNYQSSGQSALMIDLANMLGAIQAAVPYCTNISTPMSSSTPSSAMSTSLLSSLSSITLTSVLTSISSSRSSTDLSSSTTSSSKASAPTSSASTTSRPSSTSSISQTSSTSSDRAVAADCNYDNCIRGKYSTKNV